MAASLRTSSSYRSDTASSSGSNGSPSSVLSTRQASSSSLLVSSPISSPTALSVTATNGSTDTPLFGEGLAGSGAIVREGVILRGGRSGGKAIMSTSTSSGTLATLGSRSTSKSDLTKASPASTPTSTTPSPATTPVATDRRLPNNASASSPTLPSPTSSSRTPLGSTMSLSALAYSESSSPTTSPSSRTSSSMTLLPRGSPANTSSPSLLNTKNPRARQTPKSGTGTTPSASPRNSLGLDPSMPRSPTVQGLSGEYTNDSSTGSTASSRDPSPARSALASATTASNGGSNPRPSLDSGRLSTSTSATTTTTTTTTAISTTSPSGLLQPSGFRSTPSSPQLDLSGLTNGAPSARKQASTSSLPLPSPSASPRTPPAAPQKANAHVLEIDSHTIPLETLLTRLSVDATNGLRHDERRQRLKADGPNIQGRKRRSREGQHDVAYFELIDQLNLVLVVMENATLRRVRQSELVRGDVVLLHAGDQVPADMRLVHVSPDFRVDQQALTGDVDTPVAKDVNESASNPLKTANCLWQRTWVLQGYARGVVFQTGDAVLLNRIAPGKDSVTYMTFNNKIHAISRKFESLSLYLKRAEAVVPLAEITSILTTTEMVTKGRRSVSTLALNLFSPRNVVSLTSEPRIEFVYANNMIEKEWHVGFEAKQHKDKPGFDRMRMKTLEALFHAAQLLNHALYEVHTNGRKDEKRELWGHPTDVALAKFCERFHDVEETRRQYTCRWMSPDASVSIHSQPDGPCIALRRSSVAALLPQCSGVLVQGEDIALNAEIRAALLRVHDERSGRGEWPVAFAIRFLDGATGTSPYPDDYTPPTDGFCFLGILGVADLVQDGVAEVMSKFSRRGVRVSLISQPGFAQTSEAIAIAAGLIRNEQALPKGEAPSVVHSPTRPKLKSVVPLPTVIEGGLAAVEQIIDQLLAAREVPMVMGALPEDRTYLKKVEISVIPAYSSFVAKLNGDLISTDNSFAALFAAMEEAIGSGITMDDYEILSSGDAKDCALS